MFRVLGCREEKLVVLIIEELFVGCLLGWVGDNISKGNRRTQKIKEGLGTEPLKIEVEDGDDAVVEWRRKSNTYFDVSGAEVEFCIGSGGEEGDGKECERRNILHLCSVSCCCVGSRI